jgi:hypothetical protein
MLTRYENTNVPSDGSESASEKRGLTSTLIPLVAFS